MVSKKLKLMAEYGGTVLWGVDAADVGPIDPLALPPVIDVDERAVQGEMEFLWGEVYRRRVELPTATIDCFKRFSDRA